MELSNIYLISLRLSSLKRWAEAEVIEPAMLQTVGNVGQPEAGWMFISWQFDCD